MDASGSATAYFTLRFDAATERAVIDLWLALAEEGIELAGLSGHRPHITVAAYETDRVNEYRPLLDAFARRVAPFPIRFDALGVFPENGVVFLAPTVSRRLFTLHRSLLEQLGGPDRPPLRHPELLPDRWVPHCALIAGASLGTVAQAIALCTRRWQPILGMIEGIGIRVPPDTRDLYDAPFTGIARNDPVE